MGVKGLQWFVNENQASLLQREQRTQVGDDVERIPAVVDAWGLVHGLYQSSLPWASGGEYLAYHRLLCRLVKAWRAVGLEPIFVLDGCSPPVKHHTTLGRMRSNNKTALEFWTTSQESRSRPRYTANQESILPPLALQTTVHALRSLNVAVHSMASGEADAVCVAIANDLGGYVVGNDSDFLILVSGVGAENVKGVIPLHMLEWIEGQDASCSLRQSCTKDDDDGWTSTAAPTARDRTSRLLPADTLVSPTLVVTSIAPDALRRRLRLAPQLFPLFASFVGNDYVTRDPDTLYPGMTHLQKIEAAARALREASAALSSNPSDAGAQAAQLVDRAVDKLVRPRTLDPQRREQIVDEIIEATFQYVLPEVPAYLGAYPFSAEIDPRVEIDSEAIERARTAYAALQRDGMAGFITHAYLFPGRIYNYSLLENPNGPAIRSSEGLRRVRTAAWLYLEEACGGLCWPDPDPTEEEMNHLLEDKAAERLLGALDINGDTTDTNDDDDTDNHRLGDQLDLADQRQAILDELQALPRTRTMVEWIRQGSSREIIGVSVALPPLPGNPGKLPMCLQDLDVRLQSYRTVFKSNNRGIIDMPLHLQPLLSIVRFSLVEFAARHPDTPSSTTRSKLPLELAKWGRWEVEAVLKVGLGMYNAWQKDARGKLRRRRIKPDVFAKYPTLSNRSVMMVAQINAVMLDSVLLAQSLVILPTDRLPRSSEEEATQDKPLTHLTPFMFFSGLALHAALGGEETPPITEYKWSDSDNDLLAKCVDAVLEGLDSHVLDLKRAQPPPSIREQDLDQRQGPRQTPRPLRPSDGPRRGGSSYTSVSWGRGAGGPRGRGGSVPKQSAQSRFDLLKDLAA